MAQASGAGGLTPQARAAMIGAVAGGAAALVAGAAASGVAAYFARRVVIPSAVKPDNSTVLDVGDGLVTLKVTPDTVSPGRYGLWTDKGRSHARIGEIVQRDLTLRTVTRRVDQVDFGKVSAGPARWSSYYYAGTPGTAHGMRYQDIEISAELGALPTWLVPAREPGRDVWAILVHGHGATREEALRALPVLHRLGVTALVPSYRNDQEGPSSGRSTLGETEWRDVEAAVLYALDHGAADVVLFGWSMGGAIALQHVSRSWTADRVRALVLDSPVLDWKDVLDHAVEVNRIPKPVGQLSLSMIGDRTWRWLSGIGGGAVDFRRLDWVSRASELRLPILLTHSDDDQFVPSGPSRRLAEARPDLVTYLGFPQAQHCTEWNTDSDRWEREVARFLLRHL